MCVRASVHRTHGGSAMSDFVVILVGIVFLVCLCRKELRRWWRS